MDGTLDPAAMQWKSRTDVVAPLNANAADQFLCPLCARDQQTAVLQEARSIERHECARGHSFATLPNAEQGSADKVTNV